MFSSGRNALFQSFTISQYFTIQIKISMFHDSINQMTVEACLWFSIENLCNEGMASIKNAEDYEQKSVSHGAN
jgi:hypothetical protein